MKFEYVGIYSGTYKGKTTCGFETNNEYTVKIMHDTYGYMVYEYNEDDMGLSEDNIACIRYSSRLSIKRYWDLKDFN